MSHSLLPVTTRVPRAAFPSTPLLMSMLMSLLLALAAILAPRAFAQAPAQPATANTLSNKAYDAARAAEKASPAARLSDYAGLNFYAAADAALPPPSPAGPPRVVFLGDSITHNWGNPRYSDFFQRHPTYIDRGIGGQTTAQMLLRYRQDVLALNPKIVVLFGGTNDLASYKVPNLLGFIEGNIASIVELAQLHHERIILCSVTPDSDAIKPQTAHRPPAEILALDAWIKHFAAARHVPYVDFYSVLTDGHDRIQTALTIDGLHPSHAGFAKMEPLIEAAIAKESQPH